MLDKKSNFKSDITRINTKYMSKQAKKDKKTKMKINFFSIFSLDVDKMDN